MSALVTLAALAGVLLCAGAVPVLAVAVGLNAVGRYLGLEWGRR